ncbi:hypothetical protein EXN66_Car002406 [Channa argus]|uniref:Uncharacterized protein n=1 Tax=Channa argus TaxID=215402 RepID=A0A6G1P9D4_CHAAH|nr:hypothetical protein EXN66_Car002406 [Channa argus]
MSKQKYCSGARRCVLESATVLTEKQVGVANKQQHGQDHDYAVLGKRFYNSSYNSYM